MNELIDMLVYMLIVAIITAAAFYVISNIIDFLIDVCKGLAETGKAINKWLKK
jgi:predicted PurR-regulated permease PerM